MNYQIIYDNLISKAKNRTFDLTNQRIENHHILPRSMGGNDDPSNIVALTYREHFVAHHLLWRIHRNRAMAFGFHIMCANGKGRNPNNKITSRQYKTSREAVSFARTGMKFSEKAKANMSKAQSGTKNHNHGKPRTEETKAKISKANKGKKFPDRGKPRSEETKAKISAANLGRKFTKEHRAKLSAAKIGKPGPHLGKPRSEETKAKLRKANLGKKTPNHVRAKISAANMGHEVSVETRMKISNSLKNRNINERTN